MIYNNEYSFLWRLKCLWPQLMCCLFNCLADNRPVMELREHFPLFLPQRMSCPLEIQQMNLPLDYCCGRTEDGTTYSNFTSAEASALVFPPSQNPLLIYIFSGQTLYKRSCT